jgi:hypothetical protein
MPSYMRLGMLAVDWRAIGYKQHHGNMARRKCLDKVVFLSLQAVAIARINLQILLHA